MSPVPIQLLSSYQTVMNRKRILQDTVVFVFIYIAALYSVASQIDLFNNKIMHKLA